MKKILYFIRTYDAKTNFITFDIELIKTIGYEITVKKYDTISKNPINLMRQLWQDIKIAKKHDLIFSSWLVNWYPVLIAKLAKVPSCVVSGGFDTVKEDGINYGAFVDKKMRGYVRFTAKNSSKILVTHKTLETQLRQNISIKEDKIVEVHRAINPLKWGLIDIPRNGFITVSINKDASISRHKVKGIDRFVQLAAYFPEIPFILVGYTINVLIKLESNIPSNIVCISEISQDELIKYYQKSDIYCQLSRHEGLPNAVCEAILCGCRVIGSDVNGVPEAIGPSGFCYNFEQGSIDDFATKVKLFLEKEVSFEERKSNRNYIEQNFSIELRKKKLSQIFGELI